RGCQRLGLARRRAQVRSLLACPAGAVAHHAGTLRPLRRRLAGRRPFDKLGAVPSRIEGRPGGRVSADNPLDGVPLEPEPPPVDTARGGPAPVEGPSPVSPVSQAFVRPLEIVTVGGIVVFDQLTKFLVKATLPLYA